MYVRIKSNHQNSAQYRKNQVLRFFNALQDANRVQYGYPVCACYGVRCPAIKICKLSNTPCSTYLRRYLRGDFNDHGW